MSTTIPYSPSLVLGSIVEPAAMDNLLAISATQTPIDAAQETLNSFIAMKRSLEMTVQELINMGLDPKDLLKKIEEVGADVDKAATAYATVRLEQELKKLDRYDVLILDDIGYIQQSREEMEVLFTFLAERYERRSVMISSNLVFSKWDQIFKDPLTTMAAVDRLVHHAHILEFDNQSIRATEAKKRTKD